jgi:hypothetical protein
MASSCQRLRPTIWLNTLKRNCNVWLAAGGLGEWGECLFLSDNRTLSISLQLKYDWPPIKPQSASNLLNYDRILWVHSAQPARLHQLMSVWVSRGRWPVRLALMSCKLRRCLLNANDPRKPPPRPTNKCSKSSEKKGSDAILGICRAAPSKSSQ